LVDEEFRFVGRLDSQLIQLFEARVPVVVSLP